jgi:hypothetical protein
MCYLQGIQNAETERGTFRVRISAFGTSSDPRSHEEDELPLFEAGGGIGAVSVTIVHKALHALTLYWIGAQEDSTFRSLIEELPRFIDGLQPREAAWRENAPVVARAFFSAQNALRSVTAQRQKLTKALDLLPDRRSTAWAAWAHRPEIPRTAPGVARIFDLDGPHWWIAKCGQEASAYIAGVVSIGALAPTARLLEAKPLRPREAARKADQR